VILKDALALAVASVPEGLPMVATTTMALGLTRMERRGILVRRIDAIESLGAIQTICLDKTGTLTQNRMDVVEAVAGTCRAALDDRAALRRIGEAAALNNDCEVTERAVSGSSRTERALMEFAVGLDVDAAGLRTSRPRRATIERGAKRQWMATIHGGEGPSTVVKGAPAAVLKRCIRLAEDGTTRPITDADRQTILALNDALAARPARAIAFAQGTEAPDGD